MQHTWDSIEGMIDNERFEHVRKLLDVQAKEAQWWRNAMILYFQSFSKLPIPEGYEKPDKTLEYYMQLKFPDKK
jgi:alpha-glucuronidase